MRPDPMRDSIALGILMLAACSGGGSSARSSSPDPSVYVPPPSPVLGTWSGTWLLPTQNRRGDLRFTAQQQEGREWGGIVFADGLQLLERPATGAVDGTADAADFKLEAGPLVLTGKRNRGLIRGDLEFQGHAGEFAVVLDGRTLDTLHGKLNGYTLFESDPIEADVPGIGFVNRAGIRVKLRGAVTCLDLELFVQGTGWIQMAECVPPIPAGTLRSPLVFGVYQTAEGARVTLLIDVRAGADLGHDTRLSRDTTEFARFNLYPVGVAR